MMSYKSSGDLFIYGRLIIMKDASEYNVRAVERAIQILDCFDDEHPERGVSEIALAVDLHKATAHRIIVTLFNHGYLERTKDEKYRLGLRLASLGARAIRRIDIRSEALPFMTQLVERWGETCDLGIFEQGEVFYIEVLQGNHALTIAARVGQHLPAHCTASGRLFLAHLSPQELDDALSKPLAKYTDKTLTSPDEIRQQLEQIRQQGFSMDCEEFEVGICAVSAPIYNHEGRMIAAMSIPSPASRMTDEVVPKMAEELIEAAQAVSRRMGWPG
jgi:IclR family KDG regulon transcriptional repressor